MKKRYLVTGGAGFIGSNLVNELLLFGNDVIVLDNESSGTHKQYHWNDKAINHKVDITQYDEILPLFKNIDAVFHLAAIANIQDSIANPTRTFFNNELGTLNVLESARQHGIKTVVFSSTSAIYGAINSVPYSEKDIEDCLNAYSVSKANSEKVIKIYNNLYGMNNIMLRYFNVYGNNYPTVGQYVPVVGIFLEKFKKGDPLTVVGDGLQRRDFINVKDIAKANIYALKYGNSKIQDTFNIGSGKNYSILEVAKMISDNIVYLENRPGEMQTSLADISLAKEFINWEPDIDLEQWVKDQLEMI